MSEQLQLQETKAKTPEVPQSNNGNDPYRNSFIRLFGYSHVIGQTTDCFTCRPNFTKLCSSVSILYCICDVYDKFSTSKALNTPENKKKNIKMIEPKKMCNPDKSLIDEPDPYKPYIAAGNAIVWQSLASFIIPAFAVNRITYLTRRILSKMNSPKVYKFYVPPILGLASLPFLMIPIDNGVTKLIEIAQAQRENFVKDSYRDTYIRFLGYAFVISRTAYRGLHNKRKLIDLCYGVSVLYCVADAIDKCNKVYEQTELSKELKKKKKSNKVVEVDYKYQTIITAIDVFIWQGLASFLLPGYVLSSIRMVAKQSIKRIQVKGNARLVFPPVVALLSIPFIFIPIDRIIDALLENTYRKIFQ